MIKLLTILGARPQFIKAACFSRVIKNNPNVKEIIVHTGQHFDKNMSDVFFIEMDIPKPEYQLSINSLNHGAMTGRMIEEIESIAIKVKPDGILVYGDTNSTLAGALVGAKLHIPVFHVEAGLRSFNKKMPEEINRILTDHVSDLLFSPTTTAVENLINENISPDRIRLVGDVMYDSVIFYTDMANKKSQILLHEQLTKMNYFLVTIHRAENTDDVNRLTIIAEALQQLSRKKEVVFSLHPRTKNKLIEHGLHEKLSSTIHFLDPLGYFDMLALEANAALVITDSGGVQKEAYFQKVPCITLRDETEWVELVSSGWNQLVSPLSVENIISGVDNMLSQFLDTVSVTDIFGKGDAAVHISKGIIKRLQ